MTDSPRTRGRTSLVLAALAIAAVASGLWLAVAGRGAGATDAARPGAAAAATPSGGLPLAEGEAERAAERREAELATPWSSDAVGAAPGVRLAGDGRLAGVVRERESGAPLAGVRVDLLPIAPAATDALGSVLRAARVGDATARRALPVAVARSGPDGSFRFEGVRSGTYFLDARGERHVPDHLAHARVAPSGSGGPVELWVRRGGRVVGRVVHPDGRPAAGARLELFAGPGQVLLAFRRGELRRLEASADGAGRFEIGGVAPGVGYELHAYGDGFALSHLLGIEVRAGEDTAVELETRSGAVLRGRVLSAPEVLEGDGAASPVPLAGARLGAVPLGLRDLQCVEEILRATAAVTDAEGRYVMRHVPPGEVDVLAVAPGHVSGAARWVRAMPAFDGEPVDVPDVVLRAGPRVTGRVADSSGEPIGGAHVRWFTGEVGLPSEFAFSPTELLYQAVGDFRFPESDAEGRFVAGPFPGEPPHRVYFAKPGYEYMRASWSPGDGELEVVLRRGGTVEGVVLDAETREPIPSFLVEGTDRIDARPDAPGALNPFSGGELVESPDGRFRIDGVRAGRSTLRFGAPGHQPAELVVDVVEGETTGGHVVELRAGGRVAGRVVDESGEPVAGAQVAPLAGGEWSFGRAFARVDEHRSSGAYVDTFDEEITNAAVSFATRMGAVGEGATTSGPDGRYALDGVPPGELAVVARHRDFALGRSASFELAAGASRSDVEVVMPRGASLHGRVSDRWDRPIAGAFLLAISPTEFSGDRSAEVAVYQGITDADGRYVIEHMAGGGYFVTYTRGDAALNPVSLLGTLQLDLVNVPPGERVRYDLVDRSAATCRVHGTVSSAGEPVTSGGVVAIAFAGESALGVDVKLSPVRSDATYEFAGLAPGRYRFRYQSPGEDLALDVEVPDRPEERIDLELPRGGVAGRVIDPATGEGVASARVTVARGERAEPGDGPLAEILASESLAETTSTDAEGSFELAGLQEGEYELVAEPPRGRSERWAPSDPARVAVERDALTRGVELALAPSRTLAGVVLGADGRPLHRARVVAVAIDRRAGPFHERTGRDGRFELAGLPSGRFDLEVEAEEHAPSRVEGIAIGEEGFAPEVEVRLVAGAELVLRVRGPDGAPVPGAAATLRRADGTEVGGASPASRLLGWFTGQGLSDAEGRIRLGRFEPGTYRVEARRGDARGEIAELRLEEGAAVERVVVLE